MGIAQSDNVGVVETGDVLFLKGNITHYTPKAVDDPKLVSVGTRVRKGNALAALCLGFTPEGKPFDPSEALKALGWGPTRGLDVDGLLIRMHIMERALRDVVASKDPSFAKDALDVLFPKKKRAARSKPTKRKARRR